MSHPSGTDDPHILQSVPSTESLGISGNAEDQTYVWRESQCLGFAGRTPLAASLTVPLLSIIDPKCKYFLLVPDGTRTWDHECHPPFEQAI